MAQLTEHVRRRVLRDLKSYITLGEVFRAVREYGERYGFAYGGQTDVFVKKLEKKVTVFLDGHGKSGDEIYVVIDRRTPRDNGRIVTVMLRNSDQKHRGFRPYDSIPQEHTLSGAHIYAI